MKIGNVQVKRTYRPARVICDIASLAAVVVIITMSSGLFGVYKFLGFLGAPSFLIPAAAVGICAAYVILTFKSLKFKRYKITANNAQNVYNWWAFALSLVKLPLLLALFEWMLIYAEWAATGEKKFSFVILLYVLLAVIIIRLLLHRIATLTKEEKNTADSSVVKVKAKIADPADDDKEK